jgi:hypothetical protein
MTRKQEILVKTTHFFDSTFLGRGLRKMASKSGLSSMTGDDAPASGMDSTGNGGIRPTEADGVMTANPATEPLTAETVAPTGAGTGEPVEPADSQTSGAPGPVDAEETPAIDPVTAINGWISSLVPGRTFADVGGIGVNAMNEKVSLACRSGAQSATMIDIRPSDYYEWDLFHQRCRTAGVEGYHCIDRIDINDAELVNKVGVYDIVHCTGIVYHLPNPVWGVANLCKTVGEYLIINTVILPPRIANEHGTLEFGGSTVLFMPGLNPVERRILNAHYMKKFGFTIDDMSPALDAEKPDCPWFENGETTCWPYWWLFSKDSFIALITMMGFTVVDSALWEEHALTLLVKR